MSGRCSIIRDYAWSLPTFIPKCLPKKATNIHSHECSFNI